MMYGKVNPDRICRVLEKILSERDPNIEVKVRLVSQSEADEIKKSLNEAAEEGNG